MHLLKALQYLTSAAAIVYYNWTFSSRLDHLEFLWHPTSIVPWTINNSINQNPLYLLYWILIYPGSLYPCRKVTQALGYDSLIQLQMPTISILPWITVIPNFSGCMAVSNILFHLIQLYTARLQFMHACTLFWFTSDLHSLIFIGVQHCKFVSQAAIVFSC